MTSDVVNPGPESGTQTEHNNTMTSDVVNPGPRSGTQTEHNNTITSDVVNPGPGSGTLCLVQARTWIYNVTCHGIIVFSLCA
jgi:hypothetical protein